MTHGQKNTKLVKITVYEKHS